MTHNIMVVDDDPDLRETLQLILTDDGYSVTEAAGASEALQLLRSGSRPALILLDLMMPEMNGWQFLEHIRRDPVLASIPVVIMTARSAVGPLPAPAKEMLRKPFDNATLLATLARYTTASS